jgi:4-hydroxy-3-methylbut-2-enyl diphosphate reductase IspH
MSIKTRIEALEQTISKGEPPETVIVVRVVVVHNREEVEQLRAAGLLERSPPCGRPTPRGPVRLVFREVGIRDLLGTAPAVPTP